MEVSFERLLAEEAEFLAKYSDGSGLANGPVIASLDAALEAQMFDGIEHKEAQVAMYAAVSINAPSFCVRVANVS